ncbi:MAG: hypothetical protein ACTJLM_01500 [Ehrlichia sp.]
MVLYEELRPDVIMNYNSSYLECFLRSCGLNDEDVLAMLAIFSSFYQNATSYIDCKQGDPIVGHKESVSVLYHTDTHIVINLRECDYRNYTMLMDILENSEEEPDRLNDRCGRTVLMMSQMYFLSFIYCRVLKYILSQECRCDDEIVDKLVRDINEAVKIIVAKREYNNNSSDSDVCKENKVASLLLSMVDIAAELRPCLLDSIARTRECYLNAVKNSEKHESHRELVARLILVIYDQMVKHFCDINRRKVSGQFKNCVFFCYSSSYLCRRRFNLCKIQKLFFC